MKIGDRVFVHGYIDEIRKDTVIIRNDGGYFGTILSEIITGELPAAQPSNGACWGCQCEKMEKLQPEREKGYIVIRVISMVDGEDCFCSECGAYCLLTAYKFCPKCGIKFIGVRGEQE